MRFGNRSQILDDLSRTRLARDLCPEGFSLFHGNYAASRLSQGAARPDSERQFEKKFGRKIRWETRTLTYRKASAIPEDASKFDDDEITDYDDETEEDYEEELEEEYA